MKILINSVTEGTMPPEGYGGIERGNSTLIKGLKAIGIEPFLACRIGSKIKCNKLMFDPFASPEEILYKCKSEWGEFDAIHDGSCNGALYFPYKESETVVWTVPGIGGDNDLCCYLSKKSMELSCSEPLPYTLLGIDTSNLRPCYNKDNYILFIGTARKDRKYLHYFTAIAKKYKLRAIAIITMRLSDPEYVQECYNEWPFAIIDDIYDEKLKMEYIRKAKALIHCSAITSDWQDASPLAILESLSVGTPVIGNNSGGIPEMIINGETGFIIDTAEQAVDAYSSINDINLHLCREYIDENRTHIMYAKRVYTMYNYIIGKSYEDRKRIIREVQDKIDLC